jgi:hypothetical protein
MEQYFWYAISVLSIFVILVASWALHSIKKADAEIEQDYE